jgi:hypothetical protein
MKGEPSTLDTIDARIKMRSIPKGALETQGKPELDLDGDDKSSGPQNSGAPEGAPCHLRFRFSCRITRIVCANALHDSTTSHDSCLDWARMRERAWVNIRTKAHNKARVDARRADGSSDADIAGARRQDYGRKDPRSHNEAMRHRRRPGLGCCADGL